MRETIMVNIMVNNTAKVNLPSSRNNDAKSMIKDAMTRSSKNFLPFTSSSLVSLAKIYPAGNARIMPSNDRVTSLNIIILKRG